LNVNERVAGGGREFVGPTVVVEGDYAQVWQRLFEDRRNRVREIIHNTDVNRSVVKIVFDAAPVNCLQANDVFFDIDIRTAAVQASFAISLDELALLPSLLTWVPEF
jgi:hypothetical protein